MAWQTPKTNWVSTDFFNVGDFNRIKGNLLYLQDYLNKLFPRTDIESMGADKTYASMIYANEFNRIEDNLEALNLGSYVLSIGEKPVYQPNGTTTLFSELNRIEGAMLSLYERAQLDVAILPRLAVRLGYVKGVKV